MKKNCHEKFLPQKIFLPRMVKTGSSFKFSILWKKIKVLKLWTRTKKSVWIMRCKKLRKMLASDCVACETCWHFLQCAAHLRLCVFYKRDVRQDTLPLGKMLDTHMCWKNTQDFLRLPWSTRIAMTLRNKNITHTKRHTLRTEQKATQHTRSKVLRV